MFAQFYTKIFTVENDDGPMIKMQSEAVCEEIVVSLDMVLKKFKKINPNKSPGPDLLHPTVIYEVKEVIVYPLTLLFKKSLSSGQLPEDWKYRPSIISTIHKKGSRSEIGNYRSVSLTSVICKLLEFIIRDHIMSYLLRSDLLSNQQYGCTRLIHHAATVTHA